MTATLPDVDVDESVTARCAKCDRVRTLRVRDIVVTLEPLT